MERVAGVNKWLIMSQYMPYIDGNTRQTHHEQSPCRVVEKDRGSGQEHGGSDELAQLNRQYNLSCSFVPQKEPTIVRVNCRQKSRSWEVRRMDCEFVD
jgi:hypothetical protein